MAAVAAPGIPSTHEPEPAPSAAEAAFPAFTADGRIAPADVHHASAGDRLVRNRPDLAEPQELRVPGLPATDPFRIDDTVFPVPARPAESSRPGPKVAAGNAEEVEPGEVRERERAAMAAAFRVQAAGQGMEIAVVDGRTLRVGQSIEGGDGTAFRLVEVRGEGVVLECEGTRYEVQIARPGRDATPDHRRTEP